MRAMLEAENASRRLHHVREQSASSSALRTPTMRRPASWRQPLVRARATTHAQDTTRRKLPRANLQHAQAATGHLVSTVHSRSSTECDTRVCDCDCDCDCRQQGAHARSTRGAIVASSAVCTSLAAVASDATVEEGLDVARPP